MQMSNTVKATIAVIIANCIWGVSYMATKIALSQTSAHMLLSVRFLACLLIVIILTLFHAGTISLKGKPVGLFFLMGLCEPIIYYIAETNGIKYTSSSFSGLMISLIPVSTAVLSAVFLHERLTVRKLAWIFFSVLGVLVISLDQTGSGTISAKGVICLLIAMIAAGFYSILSRKISQSFSPYERTCVMMIMGSIGFTCIAMIREGSNYGPALISAVTNKYVILPVLFLSVVCSAIAYYLLNYAMTYLEINKIVVFTNIIPIVSVLAGVLILGEPFSPIFIVGIVMILTGVYKVNKEE